LDLIDFTRYVGALLVTLALLLGFLVAVKRFGPTLGLERLGLGRGAAGGPRRLQVVESLMLDPRRRLVLVRADGQEHLLLLGATDETVVESREAGGGAAP
jgi:flagellar protein FliO/FliZ